MRGSPEAFMLRAIELARRGIGFVSPNPPVGCVLVKDNQIVAEGWHASLGALHAEQMAIAEAEKRGIDTTLCDAYITLEPCHHHGRTPPCTEILLWAGIKRIFVAHPDPNPTVRGGGSLYLRNNGTKVIENILQDKAAKIISDFLFWCRYRRPLVTVKLAVDENDSVDDQSNISYRFTTEKSLELSHKLRSKMDAILVGSETILRDDSELTVRFDNQCSQPLRVIIDPRRKSSSFNKVWNDKAPTLRIVDTKTIDKSYNEVMIRKNNSSMIDPLAILQYLGDLEIQHILIEGGPKTIATFLDSDLIDRSIIIRSKISHQKPFVVTQLLSTLQDIGQECYQFKIDSDLWTVNQRHPMDIINISKKD